MVRLTLSLAIAALALAGCAHRPTATAPAGPLALDGLLGFADPATCRPSEAHARFLAAMVDTAGGVRPGRIDAPPALARAFAPVTARRTDGHWIVGTAVTGSLFGLPLGRIDHVLPVGGDPGDVTYRFDAPLATTAATLRARGFPARAGHSVPLSGTDLSMTLVADPRDAAASLFGCGHD